MLLGLAGLLASLPAQAQNWPTRFVRMVVPGGSGTAADVSARIIAQALSERWGQQVIIENRPGAGGVIGTMQIAQSAPDGYSLLFAQGAPLSLTPHAFKSVPYDVERDFEPIIFAGYGPLVLASSPKLPVTSVAELIALAKRQPGKLSFATASARSIPHLAGEYFLSAAGVAMVNVPYNGYPRAIQDTMTGTVDVIFGGAQIIPQRELRQPAHDRRHHRQADSRATRTSPPSARPCRDTPSPAGRRCWRPRARRRRSLPGSTPTCGWCWKRPRCDSVCTASGTIPTRLRLGRRKRWRNSSATIPR